MSESLEVDNQHVRESPQVDLLCGILLLTSAVGTEPLVLTIELERGRERGRGRERERKREREREREREDKHTSNMRWWMNIYILIIYTSQLDFSESVRTQCIIWTS